MLDYYFTFRSITGAQRGEKTLKKEGIICFLMRAPKYFHMKGCGYALKIPSGQATAAANVLRMWKIEYGKIYRFDDSGAPQEVTL